MDNKINMLALTFLLFMIVTFFIAIVIIISNIRKEYREVNVRLTNKIDKLEGLFLAECKTLVKEFKNLKK